MERCFGDEGQQAENSVGDRLVLGGYRSRERVQEGWAMLNARLPPAWEGCTKLARPCPAFAAVDLPSGHWPPRSFAARAAQGKETLLLSRSGKCRGREQHTVGRERPHQCYREGWRAKAVDGGCPRAAGWVFWSSLPWCRQGKDSRPLCPHAAPEQG